MYRDKTENNERGVAVLDEAVPRMYDPVKQGTEIIEDRTRNDLRCGCPCPEISVPIFAAGLLAFDPLD